MARWRQHEGSETGTSRQWLAVVAGGVMVAAAMTPAAAHASARSAASHASARSAAAHASVRPAVADGLYWVDNYTGNVNVANLNGTGQTNLVNGGGSSPEGVGWGVAVNSSNLYWSTNGGNTIREANLNGSDPSTIVDYGGPNGIALTGQHLYWADLSVPTIGEANLDGTHAHVIVRHPDAPAPIAVAVSKNTLYWADDGEGNAIYEGNLNGKNPTVIANASSGVDAITVAGSHLYWIDADGIVEASLSGTDQSTIVPVADVSAPGGLAVYDGHVYWTDTSVNGGAGNIEEATLTGGDPHVIVTDANQPTGLAIGPR
jgi:Domain of unknown function (DUF5050)